MNGCDYELITGGAGFIGTNLADRLASDGRRVLLFDDFSREGVERNFNWLKNKHGSRIRLIRADVRDASAVEKAVGGARTIYHLAAQVAVTTSLLDPIYDFEVNARGTLNVLEAVKRCKNPPFLLYTSTNKVLGGLEQIELVQRDHRYEPREEEVRLVGIGEGYGIEFCSPYGCSKGAADQYVLDYARNFGIPAVVFRMSCIYGPHQCGNEDQGWVAHFIKQARTGKVITVYGDGKQVRDALFVEDLVDAILFAERNVAQISGSAFNIGGGPGNTISLVELLQLISEIRGVAPKIVFQNWRPSDQRYYVSDTRRFRNLTGWKPKVSIFEGVSRLHSWFNQEQVSTAEVACSGS